MTRVVNGWTIRFHPTFIKRYRKLIEQVAHIKATKPDRLEHSKAYKLFNLIDTAIYEEIPFDPDGDQYRLGRTLDNKPVKTGSKKGKRSELNKSAWRRDKIAQQYRMFFRVNHETKTIIFAWVNDEDTLRAYGSSSDAYQVFSDMLEAGDPPNDWEELLLDCLSEDEARDYKKSKAAAEEKAKAPIVKVKGAVPKSKKKR